MNLSTDIVRAEIRTFKWDKWLKLLGSRIPSGSQVEVLRFMPRRRVVIRYQGEVLNTMLWCVPKLKVVRATQEGGA